MIFLEVFVKNRKKIAFFFQVSVKRAFIIFSNLIFSFYKPGLVAHRLIFKTWWFIIAFQLIIIVHDRCLYDCVHFLNVQIKSLKIAFLPDILKHKTIKKTFFFFLWKYMCFTIKYILWLTFWYRCSIIYAIIFYYNY